MYRVIVDANGSQNNQSSILQERQNRSITPLKKSGDKFEFRGQNRIHFDYEVGSPNIKNEVIVQQHLS